MGMIILPDSIYTRKGDKGKTGLLTGERIEKDNPQVEAYGTVDELITALGVAKVHSGERVANYIHSIQQRLFNAAAELATSGDDSEIFEFLDRIRDEDATNLEIIADELTEELPPLHNFVIPGGTKSAAFLHQARTVCRRAERRVIALSAQKPVNPPIIKYLNRLSDTLFVMARYANVGEGDGDDVISREGVTKQKM
jgi:cob(I)alamin adenosyltransferase